jgi:hypothetical protein
MSIQGGSQLAPKMFCFLASHAAAGRSFLLHAQKKRTKEKGSLCLSLRDTLRFSISLEHDENSLRSDTRRV